ncbi:hypothetical protein LQW54_010664 [Pestalotiopsis sp. IQ-011]
MAERKSRRKASQNATKAIAAMAGISKNRHSATRIPTKFRRSKKSPRLPEGTLTVRKASHGQRLANAAEAKGLARIVGYSDDPIQEFNDCTHLPTFSAIVKELAYQGTPVSNNQKDLLMKSLLLGFCRFLYVGGRNLTPADLHSYSTIGMPATDRAVLRGTRLRQADEDMAPCGESKPEYGPTMIHGKARWPPNLEVGGNCSCSIQMNADGRVDLEHDPYCLRKHFTTRWGVLKDQSETKWRSPQRGASVEWNDTNIMVKSEGKESGLWVDLKQESHMGCAHTGDTALIDLISSPFLLHRIVANFGAPPFTESDPYKCSWSFSFWNQQDRTCYLEISEHKGWPQAYFRGGRTASNEALQLLEWLGGDNCPLSYDYTPCGIYA